MKTIEKLEQIRVIYKKDGETIDTIVGASFPSVIDKINELISRENQSEASKGEDTNFSPPR